MAGINAMILKLEKVDFMEIIAESIEETKDDLADIQRDQLLHGEGQNGKIGEYQNPVYAEVKHRMNPAAGFGNVDLKKTGNYHRKVFVDVRTNSVVIDSADEKAKKLTEKYGENISGLNKEYSSEYSIKNLQPEAVMRIKKTIL